MRLMVIAPFHVPGLEEDQKNIGDLLSADEEAVVREPDNAHLLHANCVQIPDDAAKNIDDANAARNPSSPSAGASKASAASSDAPLATASKAASNSA